MVVERTPDSAIGDENLDPIAAELTAARLYTAQIERGEEVSGAAALVMLGKIAGLHRHLEEIERLLTGQAVARGHTWNDIATRTGRSSPQAAQQRYERLGGSSVDITPPELSPAAIAAYGAPDWAEPAATPDEVTDWDHRQAQAWIRYERDERGWPINPDRRTGRTGRNLARWGENQAADAMVVAGSGQSRQILLIQRDDIGTWALPGGMLDPGETASQAMPRELAEEAGLDLSGQSPEHVWCSYVADHRASDHAWVVTTIGIYVLDAPAAIAADDDAAAAAWWPAADMPDLHQVLIESGASLHLPHKPLIRDGLDQLDLS